MPSTTHRSVDVYLKVLKELYEFRCIRSFIYAMKAGGRMATWIRMQGGFADQCSG